MSEKSSEPRLIPWLTLLFVVVTSFFTYVYNYASPTAPFWDEPYHIASAQKYLSGVFFMEQHPPLGKLLIAAGEKIVHGNEKTDEFIKTDYAKDFGAGYSFAGYRLFPTLLGWLTAPLLFLIFLFLTGSSPIAALLSFLYIFDNAEIVHSRGAMVDSPLAFFGMLTILLFLHLQKEGQTSIRRHAFFSAGFGLAFALAFTTKLVGLIFLMLVPFILWRFRAQWKKIAVFVIASGIAFLIVYVGVWQIHFSLALRIVPELNNDGYYQASDQYKQILKDGKNTSFLSFPIMIRDSIRFVSHYNKGVPRLDLCKPDENGSPFYFWPFGARSINYRWERAGDAGIRYLYLQSNPVAWALGFLGVVLSVILLASSVLFDLRPQLKDPFLLLTFLALYGGYMAAISRLSRVMYLYHYFLPLLFSFILFALVLRSFDRIGKWHFTEQRKVIAMTILGLLIFGAFQFYRPLSYYEPITDAAFKRRDVFSLWELSCVDCKRESGLVVPVEKQ